MNDSMAGRKARVLLCDGRYNGTLAAVRGLGRQGIAVLVADSSLLAPALWSCHVAERLRCPPAWDVDRFVKWAKATGRANDRPVIYGTSDDLSLVLAMYRAELEESFLFYQPEFASLVALLDKSRLIGHARAAGLDIPETWLPKSYSEAEQVIHDHDGLLLIKPRTQSLLRTHVKGAIVEGGRRSAVAHGRRDGGGAQVYADFRRRNRLAPEISARFPDWTWPMIQRYHPEAVDRVYSLAGFRDRGGHNVVMRAAEKVLQHPRQLGTGLCFETATVDADLAAGVRRLLADIGYFGVFEAEFIRLAGRALLIDLNGRLYNQLAFDIARGLPMPTLFYEGALGHDEAVAATLASIPTEDTTGVHGFCNRSGLSSLVGLRRLLGTMSREDIARWKAWQTADTSTVIDAIADNEDPQPRVVEIIQQFLSCMRHPRAFIRSAGFDQV
jgi:D-aspartate ligase